MIPATSEIYPERTVMPSKCKPESTKANGYDREARASLKPKAQRWKDVELAKIVLAISVLAAPLWFLDPALASAPLAEKLLIFLGAALLNASTIVIAGFVVVAMVSLWKGRQ
ncbi:MAG: hypothetical protein AAGC99_14225 [Pseudomonadota bacterium]